MEPIDREDSTDKDSGKTHAWEEKGDTGRSMDGQADGAYRPTADDFKLAPVTAYGIGEGDFPRYFNDVMITTIHEEFVFEFQHTVPLDRDGNGKTEVERFTSARLVTSYRTAAALADMLHSSLATVHDETIRKAMDKFGDLPGIMTDNGAIDIGDSPISPGGFGKKWF